MIAHDTGDWSKDTAQDLAINLKKNQICERYTEFINTKEGEMIDSSELDGYVGILLSW